MIISYFGVINNIFADCNSNYVLNNLFAFSIGFYVLIVRVKKEKRKRLFELFGSSAVDGKKILESNASSIRESLT